MTIYCADCPVIADCGRDGRGRQGVWGGEFRDEHHAPLGPDADPRPHGGGWRRSAPGTWGAMSATRIRSGGYRARVRYRDHAGFRRDLQAQGRTEQDARDKLTAKLEQLAAQNEEAASDDQSARADAQ